MISIQFSAIPARRRRRDTVSAFGGYNHNPRIADGEFYDMTNLTGADYPLLSPRRQRGFYTGGSDIRALLAKDSLCYVDGTDVVIGQTHYDLGLTAAEPQMVSMGAYIILLPDRKYINTADPSDRGSLEASFAADSATLTLCDESGEALTLSDSADPADGDYRLTSGTLERYSAAAAAWVIVSSPWVRLEAEDIGKAFRSGDGVRITGAEQVGSSAVIHALGDDYLVLPGTVDGSASLGEITLERRVPELDFCVEAGNRLWGCRYGTDRDGSFVNELYATKLGDFRNWECFDGLSTDSYRVSLGSDGAFTGAISYLGDPLFFKEGCLHRVWGSMPSNFQVSADACRGVQRGSGGSLAIVGETVYYKSRLGVCAYDGTVPQDVSQALGEDTYRSAAAGAHGSRYYISMADESGEYHLFVYDTRRGLWHREDNTHAKCFASYDNDLYFLDAADGQIKTVFGTGSARYTTPIRWMAQTGMLAGEGPDHSYLSAIALRLRMEPESQVKVYLQYDSSGAWEYAGTVRGRFTSTVTLPILPRRCDHLSLRLEGRGDAKLFSLTKTIEVGG